MLDKTSDQASNLEQESYFSNANVEGVTWSEAIKEASKPNSKLARKQASKQSSKQASGFTKACSGFRLPWNKLGQKVEKPRTPRVNPKTLGAEGGLYNGLFRYLSVWALT